MSNLCRRCPCPDLSAHDNRSPAQRTRLATGAPEDASFRVVVLAGTPNLIPTEPEEPGADLDWQDAIVALAVAVLERGGTLVAPANISLVSLLAQAALPHAQPHPAEGLHNQAPVEAVETGGDSRASRRLLAPFARRNSLALLDQTRESVPMTEMPAPTETDGEYLLEAQHHPFDRELMAGALGAVVIHPDDQMLVELETLRSMEPPRLAIIGVTSLPEPIQEWARQHDPVGQLLTEEPDLESAASHVPYTLVMELLIDTWLDTTAELPQ